MKHAIRFSVSNNAEFWLALALIVFTTISIRLVELPYWFDPAFFVNGEHLMATHDAYAWLAGAMGIGNYADHFFARSLGIMHETLGLSLGAVGFWSPIIFVPMLALPICLLARSLRLTEGALVFGILTTSGLGFLVRTRLGFCDTDLISLLLPLCVSCLLAVGLGQMRGSSEQTSALTRQDLLGFVLVGLLGKLAVYSYPSNTSIIFINYVMCAAIGVFLAPAPRREGFAAGLLLMFALSFAGWTGAGVAGAWVLWCIRRPGYFRKEFQLLAFAVVAVLVLYLANAHEMFWWFVLKLSFYLKVSAPSLENATVSIKLPEIAQSVREAQNLEWGLLGLRLGGNWVIFVLGILGYGLVSWRRPALLMLLPFLVLGLASVKLGNRFAMYGTVGVGAGLGLGLSELMLMLRQSQGRRWIAQLAMACVALWPSAEAMEEMRPVPVLPQTYAQTFLELKEKTEPGALLWQWWDYGYAGQYYAERVTFGDGGRQTGPWLYPLARVHCASTSREAAQLMRYFGQAMLDSGSTNTTDTRTALFLGIPVAEIQKMDASSARQFIVELGQSEQDVATTVPNYLVLSWENLRLAAWISYYGNWDIVSGTSSPGKMQQVQGEIRVDSATGSLVVNGKPMSLDSLDVIESGETRHFDWPNGSDMHVLINQQSRQVFLMDAKMYRSMMVQMLIRPPQEFAEDFTLVVDKFPWARAYKVRE